MRLTPGLRLSPTDLSNFHACRHRTGLDLGRISGELIYPESPDHAMAARLAQLGEAHERRYVDSLRALGLQVVDLRPLKDDKRPEDEIVAATLEAMHSGAEVIVQAALRNTLWFGYADVLRRVEKPSALGQHSYEVHDAKLARETKAGTILQLSVYSELVGEIQRLDPEYFHVVTPLTPQSSEPYAVAETAAAYRRLRQRLFGILERGWESLLSAHYPEPVAHCEVCVWSPRCETRRRADDHLSFIAGATRVQRVELVARGVTTLARASELPDLLSFRPARGSTRSYVQLSQQARLQVATRTSEPFAIALELLDPGPEAGLCLLPEPAVGDLFLDFEGDPFGRPEPNGAASGREYLTGLGGLGVDGTFEYAAAWAFDDVAEKKAFEETIDRLSAAVDADPGMHVYHFGHYEPSALKRLMGRYATRGEELDRLLRGERFVDLHRVVRGALRAGVESYSIKQLEGLTGFERSVALADARRTLRVVERCLEDGAAAELPADIRATVESYNRDDVESTRALRDWLESLRTGDMPRPVAKEEEPREELKDLDARIEALQARLLGGEDPSPYEGSTSLRRLLAYLLDFHRREDKAQWWEYYRLLEMPVDELADEGAAIAGLERLNPVGVDKRSVVVRFSYPPQAMDLKRGDDLKTRDGKGFGEVWEVDRSGCTIDVRGNAETLSRSPGAVFAHTAVSPKAMQESLLELAERFLESTELESTPCGLRLLQRQPRTSFDDDPIRRVLSLDGDFLALQGPPGSGKTRTGARMVLALVEKGFRVGITAVSHKVIRNLLDEVRIAAAATGSTVRIGQKPRERSPEPPAGIDEEPDNKKFAQRLTAGAWDVAGATSWFWARSEARDSVHTLFVDEAGQMSLASTLAASPAARNLVLLGDPQQLDQPQKAIHPDGIDVSALAHLLEGAATLARERGLFLADTWRLAPSICALTSELFYEGRLRPRVSAGLERQVLAGTAGLDGSGLWWLSVAHQGRSNHAPEEIDAVAELVARLLQPGVTWRDRHGDEHPLRGEDLLVVAPYNAHVTRLDERLRSRGVRVGTVDKFQGQEAPVVIYAMAASSAEDAPKGMEFLLSPNRFNVATSRARCAVFLVASPGLLEAECRTPRHLRLANILCRYVELARLVPPAEGASPVQPPLAPD